MTRTKISAAQALTLLLLCRMFSLLAAAPMSGREAIGGGMAAAAALFSFLFQLLVFLPGWFVMLHHPGQNFAEALGSDLGVAGKAAAFLLWFVLTVQAGLSAAEFEGFLLTAVYENAPRLVFAFLFLAAAIYGSHLGLEAFSRFAYFGCALFLFLLVSLYAGLIPDFRLGELFAALAPTSQVFLETSWSFVSGNLEILCFFLILPNIRSDGKDMGKPLGKGIFLLWSGLYVLLTAALLLLATGVLGGSSEQGRLYPFYTLAMAAEGTLLARMDAVHMSVWSVLGLLRCCLLLYGANTALRCALPVPMNKGILRFASEHREAVTAVCALITVVLMSISAVYNPVRYVWRGGAVLLIVLLLLPLLSMIVRWLRTARKEKKA